MRKTITAATVAASLAVGGTAGAFLGTPALAGAARTTTGAVGWVRQALDGLVDDGTIDLTQADAVAAALADARPGRGLGHHHGGGRLVVSTAADAIGVTAAELRDALRAGRTIATVAAERGVDARAVVDALVAARRERLAERVAEGDLTQAQADQLLAGAEARATAIVEGEVRGLGGGRHDHARGRRGAPPVGDEGDDGDDPGA